jgi:hypothetical protein
VSNLLRANMGHPLAIRSENRRRSRADYNPSSADVGGRLLQFTNVGLEGAHATPEGWRRKGRSGAPREGSAKRGRWALLVRSLPGDRPGLFSLSAVFS